MKTKFKSRGTGKNLYLVVILAFITIASVYSQEKNKNGQPDIKVDVKKEYDENGNVKSYDSTYSYSYSWSGNEIGNIDSIFRSIEKNFGMNPFFDDDFFGMNLKQRNLMPGESENDSLYGYINPGDSVYSFDTPEDFFGFRFNDPYFNQFFNDPFFKDPGFNHRNLLEEHMKMIEEMQKEFNFRFPETEAMPKDTIPENQRFAHPKNSKQQPKGQEI